MSLVFKKLIQIRMSLVFKKLIQIRMSLANGITRKRELKSNQWPYIESLLMSMGNNLIKPASGQCLYGKAYV